MIFLSWGALDCVLNIRSFTIDMQLSNIVKFIMYSIVWFVDLIVWFMISLKS